jgi:hypothetical protein
MPLGKSESEAGKFIKLDNPCLSVSWFNGLTLSVSTPERRIL